MITRIQDLRIMGRDGDTFVRQTDEIDFGIEEHFEINESGLPETVEIVIWQESEKGNIFQSNKSFNKHEVELIIDYLTSLYNIMK